MELPPEPAARVDRMTVGLEIDPVNAADASEPFEGSGFRVLQVVLSLNPGGTERLVLELVRRLHREIPMGVCCLDDAGSWGEGLRAEGIDVVALGRSSGFRPALGRRVGEAAAAHRADIIHCHHYSPFVYASLARLWHRQSAVVFTEHGRLSDSGPSAKRRLANSLLSRSQYAAYAVSAELRDHIIEEGFPRDRVGVIYNGIDIGPRPAAASRPALRKALGASDDTVVVGTVARLDPVKDLRRLIRALSLLPSDPATILAIIGDGPERQMLEDEVAALGLADRVRFLGQRDDAREWLAGCDVYVNSSISEGVSLTILEAMAACLPVVATAVGGTPEVLDSTCARLVPPRSEEALAGAIAELAQNAKVRARLGHAGRVRVEERFTIDRMVNEYRNVYCGLASKRERR
jgi:L-malate glycosyltransferase